MKLRTRKQDPSRELPDMLSRLRAARGQLEQAVAEVEEAELAVDEARSVTADEFRGTIDPHEAARRRAEAEQAAVESRRVRDHLAALVQVGEEECLQLVDAVYAQREAARREKLDAERKQIAKLERRILSAEARMQRLDAERFAEERAHVDARRAVQAKSPTDWEYEDRQEIERWVRGKLHMAAGVDPLPPRLQRRGEKRLAALRNTREDPALVAERGGYALLPQDGTTPAPLPDSWAR